MNDETPLHGGEAWPDAMQSVPEPLQPAPTPKPRPTVLRLGHFRAVPPNTPKAAMQAAVAFLKNARDCIAKGWCRNAVALDNCGVIVDPLNHAASAWSIHGAMARALNGRIVNSGDPEDLAWRALQSAVWDQRACTPEALNEKIAMYQGEILDAFDAAIRLFTERME